MFLIADIYLLIFNSTPILVFWTPMSRFLLTREEFLQLLRFIVTPLKLLLPSSFVVSYMQRCAVRSCSIVNGTHNRHILKMICAVGLSLLFLFSEVLIGCAGNGKFIFYFFLFCFYRYRVRRNEGSLDI